MLRCVVFLNCNRLRTLCPCYSGLTIKNEFFHSSGNYEACLSVLYALGTQLYHPLQITSSSSTQRGSPWFCLSACGSGGFVPHPAADLYSSPYPSEPTENVMIPEDLVFQIGLQVASEVQTLWERLTGQVIVTLFLRSAFLIWFPQFFLTEVFYVLNQTGKQLLYESARKSLLHSETAVWLLCGSWWWNLAEQPVSISYFFGITLPEHTCTHRAEIVKHFFLEKEILKMLGKVTDVLCRASMFRYVWETWILTNQCP